MSTLLAEQFEDLKKHARFANAVMEPWPDLGYLITIPNMLIPAGWNRPKVTVAFRAQEYLPPIGFWTIPNLWLDTGFRREDGSYPRWASVIRDWQPPGYTDAMWWGWRVSMWSPTDTLFTQAMVVWSRFDPTHEIYHGGD